MKQIDTIMSQMTGAPVLKELANALRKYSTEFPEEEEKYHEEFPYSEMRFLQT